MALHFLFEFEMVTSDAPLLLPVGARIRTYYDDVAEDIKVQLNQNQGAGFVDFYSPTVHIGILSGSTRVWPPPPVPPPPPPRSYKIVGGSRGRGGPFSGGGSEMLYYSIFTFCQGGDYLEFTTQAVNLGNNNFPFTGIATEALSPLCCEINPLDFTVTVTHVTSLTPFPNGKITITNAVEDEALFEALLYGTAFYLQGSAGKIEFPSVGPGAHTLDIRRIGTSCFFTVNVQVNDISDVPQMEIRLIESPPAFSAVFQPVTYKWQFINGNSIPLVAPTIGTNARLAVGFVGSALRNYLNKHKKIRLVDSGVYTGTWEIVDHGWVDSVEVKVTFVGSQTVRYIPFEKIEFDLFAEIGSGFSTFEKIARIAAAGDDQFGYYNVRVEGYLQSAFELLPPALTGSEITLSRKYYMEPVVSSVYNDNNGGFKTALYSTAEDLTPYLEALVPLGPGPLNFINEQSGRGMPVLFSVLDPVDGRVKNIVSQSEEDVVSSSPIINIAMTPLSTHRVKWMHSSNIVALNTDPALPSWITILPGPANEVNLQIDAFTSSPGDYDPADYDGSDYLIFSFNAIVGCYEITFKDGATVLFVLNVCIYPVQQINRVCPDESVSIAWVNTQGGWSSFVFGKGKKTRGLDIGTITDFKRDGVLKKNSVEDVYETLQVNYAVLTERELEFIATLRYAIEAYLYNDETKQWDIPIYVDRANSTLYSSPFRQAEVSGQLSFKYAKEIKVQRQ